MDDFEVFTPHDGTQGLAWLQAHYGSGLRLLRSAKPAAFRLRKVNIMTSGDCLIRVWAFAKDGSPAVGQPATYTYPSLDGPASDLPAITGTLDAWAPRGVLNKNRVDGTGKVEFQIGSQSWIKGARGPYSAFVLSPSVGSDCLDGIGWLGGTNHEGPTELFFYEEDGSGGGTVDPPEVAGDFAELAEQVSGLRVDVRELAAHLGLVLADG